MRQPRSRLRTLICLLVKSAKRFKGLRGQQDVEHVTLQDESQLIESLGREWGDGSDDQQIGDLVDGDGSRFKTDRDRH